MVSCFSENILLLYFNNFFLEEIFLVALARFSFLIFTILPYVHQLNRKHNCPQKVLGDAKNSSSLFLFASSSLSLNVFFFFLPFAAFCFYNVVNQSLLA